jgi:type IV pilus assembly protein PilC
MPAYNYRAVDFSGRIARGRKAAANEWELAENLHRAGFELIEARAKKEISPKAGFPRLSLRLPQRLDPELLARFAAQMADLLRAGIPFPEALQDLARAAPSGAQRDALDDIHRAIHHGSTIAEAFVRQPRQFPAVFTAILAAGEKSGDLIATFTHLARYAEARAAAIVQFRRAIRYPLFLLLVTVGVIGFMTTMVIPPIVQFLNSINSQLPLMTRILIGVSDAFARYWWAGGLVLGGLLLALHVARLYSEDVARATDRLILRLPVLGAVFHKLAIARFAHSFAILYHSNAGIIESLTSAGGTLGNRELTAMIGDARRQIEAGRPLSTALGGFLPSFAAHMIRIGERSGKLGKALDDIAVTCDRDVAEATTRLIGAMEPALTLMIGGVLAWIVLAVLGPIYGNIAKIGSMM